MLALQPKTPSRTLSLFPIPVIAPLTRTCTEGETSQLSSVVGAVSWVTRQCKPELLHGASTLQTAGNHAKVLHFEEANRVPEDAVQTADKGLAFKGGAVKLDKDVVALTIADARWPGEGDIVNGSLEPFRSQKARFNGVASQIVIMCAPYAYLAKFPSRV